MELALAYLEEEEEWRWCSEQEVEQRLRGEEEGCEPQFHKYRQR
jgi:hypothetical protein